MFSPPHEKNPQKTPAALQSSGCGVHFSLMELGACGRMSLPGTLFSSADICFVAQGID